MYQYAQKNNAGIDPKTVAFPLKSYIKLWHLHHVSISHESPILVAPETIYEGTRMVSSAHTHKRAASGGPPNQGERLGFRDTIHHKSQSNSCHHVVVLVVDDVQGHTIQLEFQALCSEIALPSAEFDEIVQRNWIRTCPESILLCI